jgi:hypothetical protein
MLLRESRSTSNLSNSLGCMAVHPNENISSTSTRARKGVFFRKDIPMFPITVHIRWMREGQLKRILVISILGEEAADAGTR